MADEILSRRRRRHRHHHAEPSERRNALNTALLDELRRPLRRAGARRARVRVVVIRGAGTAFCSGRDLDEMSRRQRRAGRARGRRHRAASSRSRPRAVRRIAMVHGAAYAGGCELALHCDFRVAADVARFAMPLAKLGLVVPFPLGQKLVEIIGPAFTRQILLTGQPVDARRAYEMGHGAHGRPGRGAGAGDLRPGARTIAGNAPLSLAGMKATIRRCGRAARPHRARRPRRDGPPRPRQRRRPRGRARDAAISASPTFRGSNVHRSGRVPADRSRRPADDDPGRRPSERRTVLVAARPCGRRSRPRTDPDFDDDDAGAELATAPRACSEEASAPSRARARPARPITCLGADQRSRARLERVESDRISVRTPDEHDLRAARSPA